VFPNEPKGWRKRWLRAQKERDPKKLVELIDELNQLLTEEEKRAASAGGTSTELDRRDQC